MKRSINNILLGADLEPHEQSMIEDYARYLISTLPESETKTVFPSEMLGKRATISDLKMVLSSLTQKMKLDSHPVAAMLAAVAGSTKKTRERHERLKAWTLLACVTLEDHDAAIASACRRVRRLATSEDRWLLKLVNSCSVETPNELLDDLANRKNAMIPNIDRKNDAQGYIDTHNLSSKLAAKIRKIEAIECIIKDFWYRRPDRSQDGSNEGGFTYRPPPVKDRVESWEVPENILDPELQAQIIADKPRQRGLDFDDDFNQYGQLLDCSVNTKPEYAADRKKGSRDRQAIANSIEMRATHPVCHWDSLTPNEVRRTIQATYPAAVEGCVPSLFIALGLIFGRRPSELTRYEKHIYQGNPPTTPQWRVTKKRIDLVRLERNPKFKMTSEERELCYRTKNYLVLPVPLGLSKTLRPILQSIWSSAIDLSDLDQKIDDHRAILNKKFNLRLTERRIGLELHRFLFRAGESDVLTNRLRGTNTRGNYKGHYDYSNQSFLQDKFEQYSRNLLDHAGRSEDWVDPRFEAEPLGSNLCIKPQAISYYFAEQRSRLQTLLALPGRVVDAHNKFVIYVYQLLTLSTGHRPVCVPFETIKDFDLVSRELYLCDKVQPHSHEGRTVVLSDIAHQQLLYYLQHLKTLQSVTRRTDLFVSRAAANALEGIGPILFFIRQYRGRSSPIELSPGTLTQQLREDWPFEKNWHRHYLRTELITSTSHESVDAFLGHHDNSPAGFSRFSRLSYSSLRDLAKTVNECLRNLGVEALKGIQ